MTSRVSFRKMVGQSIRSHIWFGALGLLLFFLTMPLQTMLGITSRSEVTMVYQGEELTQQLILAGNRFNCMGSPGNYAAAGMVIILAIAGGIMSFEFLHSRRKMDLMAALPVKRGRLFLTEMVSALILFVGAWLINALLMIPVGIVKGFLSGQSLLYGLIMLVSFVAGFLSIYLVTALAMILTGNVLTGILGTGVFLGMIPGLLYILTLMPETFFDTCVSNPGTGGLVVYSSPIACLLNIGVKMQYDFYWSGLGPFHWPSFAVLILIALGIGALSYWLIGKRPAEAAGRAMAFLKTEAPIKLFVVFFAAFMGGLAFYAITGQNRKVWMAFGVIFVGCLAAILTELIYRQDKKHILDRKIISLIGMGGAALVLAIFLFDLTGYNRWVPQEKDVKAVMVTEYAGSEAISNMDMIALFKADPEQYACPHGLDVMREGTQQVNMPEGDRQSVVVTVLMKNGSVAQRRYLVSTETACRASENLARTEGGKALLFPMLTYDPAELKVEAITIFGKEMSRDLDLTDAEKATFIQLYAEDLKAMGYEDIYAPGNVGYLEFRREDNDRSRWVPSSYPIGARFTRSWQFLKNILPTLPETFDDLPVITEIGADGWSYGAYRNASIKEGNLKNITKNMVVSYGQQYYVNKVAADPEMIFRVYWTDEAGATFEVFAQYIGDKVPQEILERMNVDISDMVWEKYSDVEA
ncbi:MAG: ABC transporter permease [Lachnospiraceae bacterium]|nr:ABC transporter permease [Lachnospiraceae bacterium]